MNMTSMDSRSSWTRRRTLSLLFFRKLACRLRLSTTKLTVIFLSALLLGGSIAAYCFESSLLAANAGTENACRWHTVTGGDTLTLIARQYHTTISTLVHANAIHNPNLIFVGQRLCIPHGGRSFARGIQAGRVSWYNYGALDWSDRPEVHNLLVQAAARHHLPRKLVLAIAWQESGWRQHVIAWDGGIGVMQLMPYTAMGINSGIDQELDPYGLWDNIDLGTTYLSWLWQEFHGNLPDVISGYNEGGWSVRHWGIFNWHYVNNVLALMRDLN
jgi:LysM repeat protein